MKKATRLFAGLLAALLAIGSGFGISYAKSDSGTAASSLAAYMTIDGKTTLLHDYSIEEMTNLIDGKEVKYSSIDAMPARVLTVGSGVYLSTLVSDLKKYTEEDTSKFEKIKVIATDNWTRTFTWEELSETKYYYPGLFHTDTWDPVTGKSDTSAAAGGVPVKPMLAVSSWQGRVLENTGDISTLIGGMSSDTMFRLCVGMSSSDLTSGESTTSEYGKWICRVELVMGDHDQSTQGEWKSSFKDVRKTDWFYPAVQYVCSNLLFQGTSTDTFSPDERMTRGMFVTVLGRFAKVNAETPKMEFKDVEEGKYYAPYVGWASGESIVSGSGGIFRPEEMVTREEIALMLFRYAKLVGADTSNTGSLKCQTFSDYNSVMSTAREAVCWAVNNEIITGSSGRLDPKGQASRAQVAQMMKNLAVKVGRQ